MDACVVREMSVRVALHGVTHSLREGPLPAWPDETDFYQWWYTNENTMEYDAGEAAVDHISKNIREEGPVDGLLGFSQGGALACMCAALQQKADDERLNNASNSS
ncbi:unnamed protein product [Vitrella brassicaformis CCMP3155]|uniref:Serine hydrolase domain-containing protein n=1 Tax=Vitrella brassicaformis (strain CCMP3155) TaxID=1169540 RepID=A0A0G4EWV9_VITBC|nr:unnamed protein product [Vitrella brassicaformis CCMP3155]|eukprot:CEM02564.1 unnamed protein product [Vitrella brassicaformis CCMP3155]